MRESEKVIEQRGVSVVANLRPSLIAKNSAIRMKAVASSLQAVVMKWTGIKIAETNGETGSQEPSV